MFDDGKVEIYKKIIKKSTTGKPVEHLEYYSKVWYGEINFTISEYYSARQANTKVDKRIRIHQDKSVCNKFVIIMDGEQYDIGRVFNGEEKGILITDITLERVVAKYAFK